MELSIDQNLHEEFKFFKSTSESVSPKPTSSNYYDLDIIDVSHINFEDDESWLYKAPGSSIGKIENLGEWLRKDISILEDECFTFHTSPMDYQKNIDSRTFTRPKKRFTRPSIEKYNEEVYGSGNDPQNEKSLHHDSLKLSASYVIQEGSEPSSKPLSFDLTQPTYSYYFESIANSAEIDSFQNMSPPSLVNSMCSSTFANLMESSFIKNDPVLREIRDTDYTETILLQDSEPPMFQSITESCSSINSDTPESFLKKVSCNGTLRKSLCRNLDKSSLLDKTPTSSVDLDVTYEKPREVGSPKRSPTPNTINEETSPQSFPHHNGTYRRTPKSNCTFRKSDVRKATQALNSTYEMSPKPQATEINNSHQNTQTLIKDCSRKSFESSRTIIREDTVENLKRQLSDVQTAQIKDLNRLSYCLEDNLRLDSTFTDTDNDLNRTVNMKRSSLGCSTGSADSLDRMSSLSNSSRGSSKMLEMADVDAIVEMQERSLQQVMSTPKPSAGGPKKLWENNFISPIVSSDPPLSDSEEEEEDEYKSVKSTFSSKASLENCGDKTTKSLGYLGGQKPLYAIPTNNRAATYGNLRTAKSNIPGSQTNLYRPTGGGGAVKHHLSATNLKTMGPRLKGSYTSLRPVSANLPVAPPPIGHDLNATKILAKATAANVTQNVEGHGMKVVEVPPMPRERVFPSGDFIKPQVPRSSGLPRPTGIPRPASRIPGPRPSNLRPDSSRSTNCRRQTTKDDYQ